MADLKYKQSGNTTPPTGGRMVHHSQAHENMQRCSHNKAKQQHMQKFAHTECNGGAGQQRRWPQRRCQQTTNRHIQTTPNGKGRTHPEGAMPQTEQTRTNQADNTEKKNSPMAGQQGKVQRKPRTKAHRRSGVGGGTENMQK